MSILSSPPNETAVLDRTHRAALLERIYGSVELKRAARLREFLRYVGERSLDGEQVQVSEQEIGVHVFGRSADYDTGIDSEYCPRQRLGSCASASPHTSHQEGAHETLLLEIPRGSYTPHFRVRATEAEARALAPPGQIAAAAAAVASRPEAATLPARRLPLIGAVLLVLALVAACLFCCCSRIASCIVRFTGGRASPHWARSGRGCWNPRGRPMSSLPTPPSRSSRMCSANGSP